MTEPADTPFARPEAVTRLKKRRSADIRFRFYGLAAVSFALCALGLLIGAVGVRAYSAMSQHVLVMDLTMDQGEIIPDETASPDDVRRNIEGFYRLVREELITRFPEAQDTLARRKELDGLVARLAVQPLARKVSETPSLIGKTIPVRIPVSDELDLFLKGEVPKSVRVKFGRPLTLQAGDASRARLEDADAARRIQASLTALEDPQLSVLLSSGKTVFQVTGLTDTGAELTLLTGGPSFAADAPATATIISTPAENRTLSDQQIAWGIALKDMRAVRSVPRTGLLTQTDSTFPELAGSLAAIVGSLLTMIVTAIVAVPIGIFAAIYLEEFAPRNRLTRLIEVNINNLAAVPSIVFGLLGAALLLGTFNLPRSAPLVGGIVLGLLILPVVIIASRAALRSVPQSVRDGALAVGASRMQAVFHHVLPLAAPGMLTGAILGMARALGETAPLLLIGMVAFVAEVPSSVTDESTALPVLIYSWATNAERAWEPMTAAAIVILLSLLVIMNVVVVILRRRFERRW